MRKFLSTIFAFVLAFTALGVNPLVSADEYEYVWSSTNGGDVSTVVRNGVRYERLSLHQRITQLIKQGNLDVTI